MSLHTKLSQSNSASESLGPRCNITFRSLCIFNLILIVTGSGSAWVQEKPAPAPAQVTPAPLPPAPAEKKSGCRGRAAMLVAMIVLVFGGAALWWLG